MASDKRHRMAVRLSTELRTALTLSAERSGLPEATQAMVLLRTALARTMESREYADRLAAARRERTRGDFLGDLVSAAEELARDGKTRGLPAADAEGAEAVQ